MPSARRGSPGRRNAPNPDPPPNHTRPGCVPGRAVSLGARCVSDESHSCRWKTSGRRMVAGSAAPPVESSGPSPSGYRPSVRVAIGLQRSVPPRPPQAASYAVRVPRAGSPPTTAFPLHPCHAVAVRLGVPTTTGSPGGLPPPGHFPIGFRLTVIRRPNRRRRAMSSAHRTRAASPEGSGPFSF